VAAILVDRVFVSPSWSHLVRRHWPVHIGLMLTWSLLFVTGIATGVLSTAPNASANVGFSIEGISPMQYLLTQSTVLIEYLRLTVWPASLHVMYDVPLANSIGDALPAGLVIVVLLILTVVLLRKAPSFGVPAALFFIILAPTSSIVPIRDLYFEHRMYLPLAMVLVVIIGLMMKLVSIAAARRRITPALGRRVIAVVAVLAVIALTARTMQRNRDYVEPARLWLTTTAVQPENFNAWSLLGQRYMETGQYDRAIPALETAREVALARGDVADDDRQLINVILSLGIARGATGDIDSSVREYTRVLERDPANLRATYNRSIMYMRMQRYAEALQDASRAVDLAPNFAAAHLQVGDLLVLARDEQQAMRAYARVTELDPYHEPARTKFAALLINAGFFDEAEEQLRQSLAINPRSTIALYNIGRIRERQKRTAEAIRLYRAALEVQPDFAPAHVRLEALGAPMRSSTP
ncbi:MAG: tetratricopeptide repeat protein, partial [Phycisphaerales bacterium]|nr:tetratricopeptide repeat protein [Phycisphaerales bacterium]